MNSTTFIDAVTAEIPKFVSSFILLILAWVVGQRLTISWNIHQKRKENDLATARDFHDLYGEFFSTWKLWNYYIRDVGSESLTGATRWELLKRACESEGKLESTLVRLACERTLQKPEIEVLGKFRQVYQQLRQAIRDDQPLKWDSSDNQYYVTFKELAPKVATLIVTDRKSPNEGEDPSRALREITSNKWEFRGRG